MREHLHPLHPSSQRFTAFSLPGQFAPCSKSANRTLAKSLPGAFAPWPFRSPERNGQGTFVSWNFRDTLTNYGKTSLKQRK